MLVLTHRELFEIEEVQVKQFIDEGLHSHAYPSQSDREKYRKALMDFSMSPDSVNLLLNEPTNLMGFMAIILHERHQKLSFMLVILLVVKLLPLLNNSLISS
jgi:hypothetical protein